MVKLRHSFFCSVLGLSLVYAGLAYAQAVDTRFRNGVTFTARSLPGVQEYTNTAYASCGKFQDGAPRCDPIQGDTLCDTRLPMLCILDIDAAVPITLKNSKYWSGGVLAQSSPLRGSDVVTLKDANKICSDSFGDNWRVASFHDGGGWAIVGYGILDSRNASSSSGKMWIDIKDQPAGTCWAR